MLFFVQQSRSLIFRPHIIKYFLPTFLLRKMRTEQTDLLADCANRLRVTAIEITSAAKSGHPTSSG